jgi:lipoprotein-anchoring transpeptidase ErfK/SrfK
MQPKIFVNVAKQELNLALSEQTLVYPIATAKNGVGQANGSECTPLGQHRIRAKIGAGCALGTVFVGRRTTGEIFNEQLALKYPQRDWILSRILWLCGNDVGYNRLGSVDTMRRYIYIHGAPDFHQMGIPSSHGCIKMRNEDVVELFDLVTVGTIVTIAAA